MIYLLHGEETILSREKLNGIIKTYVDKYQYLNFFDFDFSKDSGVKKNSFEGFKSSLNNASLFVTKKLVVGRNLFDEPAILEKFLNFIESGSLVSDQDSIIILFEDRKLKDQDIIKIKKIAKVQEFKKINNQDTILFIKKEIDLLGAVIDQEVIDKLVFANKNIYWIKNELKKLAAFDKKIDLKNFELLSISEKNSTIFEMTDSLAMGNKKQAFIVFEELLKRGESEMGIFAMIIFLVRSLLIVNDPQSCSSDYVGGKIGEIGDLSFGGLNPYVFNKLKRVSYRFSPASLRVMYQDLFEIELAIKTGRGQIKPLLTNFFFRF